VRLVVRQVGRQPVTLWRPHLLSPKRKVCYETFKMDLSSTREWWKEKRRVSFRFFIITHNFFGFACLSFESAGCIPKLPHPANKSHYYSNSIMMMTLFFSLTIILSSWAAAQTVECGDSRCFNGGTCLSQIVNGATEYHCDCSATVTSSSAFAGTYCQYAATVFCPTNDGASVNLFCVNGGTCKSDPYNGCSCNDPYTGFSCEYKISQVQSKNDDGNYDTVTSNHTPVYSGTKTSSLPNPIDPTTGSAPTPSPVSQQTSSTYNQVGSIVSQNQSSNGGTTGTSNGGYIGKSVYYNQKDYLPDNNKDDDVIKEMTMPPVNDINICTTNGSTLNATPLSFCVNGGTCLRMVTTLQG
jgi:hypothetical protein